MSATVAPPTEAGLRRTMQDPSWYGRGVRTHSEPRSYWASATGCGNYHFRIENDDWTARRNAQVARMEEQTRALKAQTDQFGVKSALVWDTTRRDHIDPNVRFQSPTKHQKLTRYEVNSFIYASSTKPVPPPEQNGKTGHWVCEVNSTTGTFNVVNNLNPNPFNQRFREAEVDNFRAVQVGKTPAAGQVQPQPVIACYDLPSFVPVRHPERMRNYNRVKPNL
ncbi:unnamed protein product [Amoebophrya sp. A25]|nr:unnamed protein product [Amoebophrya sp. A25]|eukprot:GSA25T00013269001.1